MSLPAFYLPVMTSYLFFLLLLSDYLLIVFYKPPNHFFLEKFNGNEESFCN